uniref:Uncharacterized protein n=1 Tax=Arundo donax TaxID=35708 RepID=A0A0A9H164_ARUDO
MQFFPETCAILCWTWQNIATNPESQIS